MVHRAYTDEFRELFEQAWPYGYAVRPLAMESLGILEFLHAADEQLKQYLPVLEQHSGSVTVKVSSDCQAILRHISSTWQSKDS